MPQREQQLKDALTKVGKAKMAEEKANMLVMNGDVDGAWETIELAAKDWPDDMKLNKMLADLSGRSADFVSALNKARDAEAKKEIGYSLTWYVNAQSSYPAELDRQRRHRPRQQADPFAPSRAFVDGRERELSDWSKPGSHASRLPKWMRLFTSRTSR